MRSERTYYKRRKNGLCVNCGSPNLQEGRIRCHDCLVLSRAKARLYRAGWSDEKKRMIYDKSKQWFKDHPEKADEYKEKYRDRKAEYNRRYREK